MTVHLLGTGAAVSDAHRTTTMLAVETPGGTLLVDCGGDAVQRMLACGLDPLALEALVLTHQHPDHISGFALLVEKLWLMGRTAPLPVVGPHDALAVARTVFEAYNTSKWTGLPPIDWRPLPMAPATPAWTRDGLAVTAWPVDHPVPTVGLRVETADGVLGYSCDTAPCPAVVDIGRGADVFVHEATGHLAGVHSSAEDAARAAVVAAAHRLVLVHLPPGTTEAGLDAARAIFPDVAWGVEGEAFRLAPVEPV